MVIEIAAPSRWQLLTAFMEKFNRVISALIAASAALIGTSVLLLPGFDAGAMMLIKTLLGFLLIGVGVAMAQVGGSSKPVELAFDRETEEWKLSSRKGRAQIFEPLAPRGSVLRVNGLNAAMRSDREEPLFDFHLQRPARTVLEYEAERLATAG